MEELWYLAYKTLLLGLHHKHKVRKPGKLGRGGAGNWAYLWRVMVPIAKPAIVTNVLLGTITSWNSFLWPMLVTNVPESRTLPFGLYAFMHESGIRYERLMAGATIVVLPMMILFLFARKSIVSGVARGGIKG